MDNYLEIGFAVGSNVVCHVGDWSSLQANQVTEQRLALHPSLAAITLACSHADHGHKGTGDVLSTDHPTPVVSWQDQAHQRSHLGACRQPVVGGAIGLLYLGRLCCRRVAGSTPQQ